MKTLATASSHEKTEAPESFILPQIDWKHQKCLEHAFKELFGRIARQFPDLRSFSDGLFKQISFEQIEFRHNSSKRTIIM